jgi:zinc D-Ala-D-Ala dipeptidase
MIQHLPDLRGDPSSRPETGQSADQSDHARRTYWTARMDEADRFMRRIMTYAVEECSEPMASLVDAVQAAGVEVAFSDRPHVDGLPRLYYLRRSLIAPFLTAAQDMNRQGWVLKVEDGYRTLAMQRGLSRQEQVFRAVLRMVRWESGLTAPPAELMSRRLAAMTANAPKVGTHMSGSAIDITVLQRDSGDEVDRGGPYLEMSERTPMESPFVPPAAQENRRIITALMRRCGFTAYPWEFWHYNAGDAYAEELAGSGRPARFGAVHLDLPSGSLHPVKDPEALLNSTDDIRALIGKTLTLAASSAG